MDGMLTELELRVDVCAGAEEVLGEWGPKEQQHNAPPPPRLSLLARLNGQHMPVAVLGVEKRAGQANEVRLCNGALVSKGWGVCRGTCGSWRTCACPSKPGRCLC